MEGIQLRKFVLLEDGSIQTSMYTFANEYKRFEIKEDSKLYLNYFTFNNGSVKNICKQVLASADSDDDLKDFYNRAYLES